MSDRYWYVADRCVLAVCVIAGAVVAALMLARIV